MDGHKERTRVLPTSGMSSLEDHHCHVLHGLAKVFSHEALAHTELQLRDGVDRTHAALLAALSPVLQDRLARDSTCCSLSEVALDTWRTVVQFCCGSGDTVTQANVEEVSQAASLLQLWELQSHCQQLQASLAEPNSDFSDGNSSSSPENGFSDTYFNHVYSFWASSDSDDEDVHFPYGASNSEDFIPNKYSKDKNSQLLSSFSSGLEESCSLSGSAESGGDQQRLQLLSTLMRCQEEGRFCDYQLQLKDGTVAAIGPMMAALSDFFFAMLTLEMTEHQNKVVALPSVTRADWQCLTSFYFGSRKLVTEDNAMDLIEVGEMYQLHHLKEYCGLLLLPKMDMDDYMAYYRMFHTCSMPRPLRQIAGRFSEFCRSDDFLQLTQEELLGLLQNADLVVNEDNLCERLIQWLQVHKASTATATEVLSKLMLHCLSGLCLETDLLPSSFVQGNASLESAVREELDRRHLPLYLNSFEDWPTRRGCYRSAHDVVVVGYSSSFEFLVYSWCQEERIWIQHPGPSVPVQECFASAVVRECLFVTGGRGSSDTHVMDSVQKAWRPGPKLATARFKHAMAVVDDVPYVVGGKGESAIEVEAYSEGNRAWVVVGKLNWSARRCTAASVGETILVSGGGGSDPITLQGFNVRTGQVTELKLPPVFLLPNPANLAAATHSGDAFFLHANGQMYKVSRSGSTLSASRVIIPDRNRALEFPGAGLYVAWGWMLVVGGTIRTDFWCLCLCKGRSVHSRCKTHGFENLPQCMKVSGVYNLRLSAS